MKIQLLSDLHLIFEHKRLPRISDEADVLVMAGDIDSSRKRLRKYFKELRVNYNMPVVMVLGNHDYYNRFLNKAATDLQSVAAKFENIHILSRSSVKIDDVTFLGTTLWTDFDNRRGESEVYYSFPDYRKINKVNDDCEIMTVDTYDILTEHRKDRDWLNKSINKNDKTVVVTHHVPTTSVIPDIYRSSSINGGFYVDMSETMLKTEPNLWLCGHTHYYFDYKIGNTKIYCNPWGYPFEYNNKGHYKEEFLIEI